MGNLADNPVHHAGGAGGGGNLSGVEYVQAQGVVGLVSGPVGDGRSLCQSQGLRRFAGEGALDAEGGFHGSQHGRVEAEVVQQFLAGGVLPEVPENAL